MARFATTASPPKEVQQLPSYPLAPGVALWCTAAENVSVCTGRLATSSSASLKLSEPHDY